MRLHLNEGQHRTNNSRLFVITIICHSKQGEVHRVCRRYGFWTELITVEVGDKNLTTGQRLSKRFSIYCRPPDPYKRKPAPLLFMMPIFSTSYFHTCLGSIRSAQSSLPINAWLALTRQIIKVLWMNLFQRDGGCNPRKQKQMSCKTNNWRTCNWAHAEKPFTTLFQLCGDVSRFWGLVRTYPVHFKSLRL